MYYHLLVQLGLKPDEVDALPNQVVRDFATILSTKAQLGKAKNN